MMRKLFVRIGIVVAITALCTWFIPGIDDAVESFFQIAVLVASSI